MTENIYKNSIVLMNAVLQKKDNPNLMKIITFYFIYWVVTVYVKLIFFIYSRLDKNDACLMMIFQPFIKQIEEERNLLIVYY